MGERPSYGDRPPRPRPDFNDRPPRPREDFAERPPRGDFAERAPRGDFVPQARGPRPGGFAPRPMDDGGMSIRLDPRRLNALKLLAAEAGLRPGELVTRWTEERLDAARPGSVLPVAPASAPDALRGLSARIDELARRLDALTPTAATAEMEPVVVAAQPKRRGRPPKAAVVPAEAAAPTPTPGKARSRKTKATATKATATKATATKGAKVALHDEISAVIGERGPQTTAELAAAITERANYRQPRSAKPLDAATVSARVSNRKYRPLFVRREGRIGLAE